jgi:ABC-2 type transport system ATP-binding protein
VKSLKVSHLQHSYGDKQVLKDISFSIAQGECYSLLGPNGAGKSTCISIVLNHLEANSGEVSIFGKSHFDFSTKALRSCTPQDARFPDGIKAKEVLKFVATLYPEPIDLEKIVQDLKIQSFLNHKVQVLSGGQRSLLSLACAFIANTKLVLLDEPTTGLDIETRYHVWQYIKNYTENGGSVLLTSHHLEEAEFLSDRVGFLYQGRIVKSGSFLDLKKETQIKKISFQTREVEKLSQFKIQSSGENSFYFESFSPEKDLKDILATATVEDLRVEDIGLEKLFHNMIARGDTL